MNGKIIEDYSPLRKRVLVYGMSPLNVPVHVVLDYSNPSAILIVTAYVPTTREWHNFETRKIQDGRGKKVPPHGKRKPSRADRQPKCRA